MAQLVASHVLILLLAGIALLAVGVWIVAALAAVAARHKALLRRFVDLFVPDRLEGPLAYVIAYLAIGLALIVPTAAFLVIAENVVAGRELAAFDVAFAQALRAETSPAWHTTFWYLTWLGSAQALTPVAVAVTWMLARRGHSVLAIMWGVSQGGAALLNYALKASFGRARPEGADPALYMSGLSFPSGHAMGTLVLCGVGAYLVLRLVPLDRGRAPLIVLLLAWPLVIGFSRLYLGVHYVSDVIAGFLAGTAWITICVSAAEVALRRRAV
jgi:membrane-associated phospholipid phosphatase